MKRSSKKKKNEIAETIEASSEEIVESAETASAEVPATEAETVELSAAEMESSAEEEMSAAEETEEAEAEADVEEADELPKTVEVSADKSDEADELPKTVEISAVKTVSASAGGGMSASTKGLITVLVILALGGVLLAWKIKTGGVHHAVELNGLNKAEMELLLKDANPMMLKRLADDPEMKKQQLDNLRQLFALANAAQKEGLTTDQRVKNELNNIAIELTAVSYDREINKDKGSMPPFGFIGEERVKAFWGESQTEPSGFDKFLGSIGLGSTATNRRRQAEFDKFLNTKIELAKESGQIAKDLVPTEDDIKQAKDYFAKTRIYYDEAMEKMPTMSEDFRKKTDISIKLQQASYLSRLYATKVLAEKVKVTDEDIQKYIAEHPELDQSVKRTKAEEILNRAKAGEDFAKLAQEFSEDPGSKEKGGLYENITAGQFMAEFEQAALALEPGQIAPNLVETTYGYHIIKLEKKGETKGADGKMQPSYNVRHILITTGIQDPENPMSGPMPVKEYVSTKLEAVKEKEILDKILADNPVEVAEDFEIPKVSDEEMQQMMQQQMQMMQQQQNPQVQTNSNSTTSNSNTSNSNTSSNRTRTNTTTNRNQTNKK